MTQNKKYYSGEQLRRIGQVCPSCDMIIGATTHNADFWYCYNMQCKLAGSEIRPTNSEKLEHDDCQFKGITTSGFVTRKCPNCDKDFEHANGAPPKYCEPCSRKELKCRRCWKDLI